VEDRVVVEEKKTLFKWASLNPMMLSFSFEVAMSFEFPR